MTRTAIERWADSVTVALSPDTTSETLVFLAHESLMERRWTDDQDIRRSLLNHARMYAAVNRRLLASVPSTWS